jgi:hypothetical protein
MIVVRQRPAKKTNEQKASRGTAAVEDGIAWHALHEAHLQVEPCQSAEVKTKHISQMQATLGAGQFRGRYWGAYAYDYDASHHLPKLRCLLIFSCLYRAQR